MYMVLRGDVLIKRDDRWAGSSIHESPLGLVAGSPYARSALADSPTAKGGSPTRTLGGSPLLRTDRDDSPGPGGRGSGASTPRDSADPLPPADAPKGP